jgi:NADH:ubiquinone oxidoreductase subunit E
MVIEICIGSACHLKGSYRVIEELQKEIESHQLTEDIELKGAFCLGQCTEAVSVRIDGNRIVALSPEMVGDFIEEITGV